MNINEMDTAPFEPMAKSWQCQRCGRIYSKDLASCHLCNKQIDELVMIYRRLILRQLQQQYKHVEPTKRLYTFDEWQTLMSKKENK